MLNQISKRPTRNVSLTNLRSVYVNDCNRMRSLFSHSIAQGLAQLEKLQIINFSMIKEVFPKESEEEENTSKTLQLTRLQHLKFQNLPSLTTICNEIASIEFPSLSNLDIYDLATLKSLSSTEQSDFHWEQCWDISVWWQCKVFSASSRSYFSFLAF